MLQQPFNPKNVDATDNQKEFWKKVYLYDARR